MFIPAIIEGVLSLGKLIIPKLFPDKEQQAKAMLELERMEREGELAQIAINLKEAGHRSLFVAGWRPFVGWVCGSALAYTYVIQPLLIFVVTLFKWEAPPLPVLDLSVMMPVLLGMLGLAGMRSWEKKNDVQDRH